MSVLFPAWFARINPGKDRHTNPDDYCANADQRNLSLTLRAPNQAERRPKALIIEWSRDYLTFPYSTLLTLRHFRRSGGIAR